MIIKPGEELIIGIYPSNGILCPTLVFEGNEWLSKNGVEAEKQEVPGDVETMQITLKNVSGQARKLYRNKTVGTLRWIRETAFSCVGDCEVKSEPVKLDSSQIAVKQSETDINRGIGKNTKITDFEIKPKLNKLPNHDISQGIRIMKKTVFVESGVSNEVNKKTYQGKIKTTKLPKIIKRTNAKTAKKVKIKPELMKQKYCSRTENRYFKSKRLVSINLGFLRIVDDC